MTADKKNTFEKLKGAKEIYVLMSDCTKMPFVLCDSETYDDEVLLFYTEEEAKQILITKLEEELKNNIQEENIVNTQINSKTEGQTIEVELIYEVLENIGTNEKILF